MIFLKNCSAKVKRTKRCMPLGLSSEERNALYLTKSTSLEDPSREDPVNFEKFKKNY